MKTVAVISEYNPFHLGHEYQIKKIREEFGSDTRIIAIMSGNYTQRGDVAVMDKSMRAEMAVRCGVNLVLELPFPFSISSAEIFAKSGVAIADALGTIDYLSFGSESGDIKKLETIAEVFLSKEYNDELSALISNEDNLGYPALCELAYKRVTNASISSSFFSPNNILAIEYIKALISSKSKILPHTIKRFGADYNSEKITENEFQSATAIRNILKTNIHSALPYIPNNAHSLILSRHNQNLFPCDSERLASAVISHFRLNLSEKIKIHDTSGGLYNRLRNASFEADTIQKLIEIADTKKFTTARIRRAIWYSYFGVTSSKILEKPRYTQVLAMDSVGKSILKEIKKMAKISVLTKPSAASKLTETALEQKLFSDKADSVFHLAKPSFVSGNETLRTTPFIMK